MLKVTHLLLKGIAYLLMVLFAALLAGAYGCLHDQISYTVSPEYFTEFKFIQFDLPWAYDRPRWGAAVVGFLATWWMGVIVGILIGPFGFMFKTPGRMLQKLSIAYVAVVVAALLTALTGLAYGWYEVTDQTIDQYRMWVPKSAADPVAFMRVGVMHDASYLGGLTGLIAGIVYLCIARWRDRRRPTPPPANPGV